MTKPITDSCGKGEKIFRGWILMKPKIFEARLGLMFPIKIYKAVFAAILVFMFSIAAGVGRSYAASAPMIPISSGRYILNSKRSRITAFVRSTLHDFETAIPKFNGKLILPESGELSSIQFHLEFPTEKMKTDNVLRDDVMHSQAMEVEKYPKAAFTSKSIRFVRKSGKEWEYSVLGVLSMHGVEKELTVPVRLRIENNEIISTSTFPFHLSTHNIFPPGIFFVKVEDTVKVDVQLTFRRILMSTNKEKTDQIK